MLVDCVSDLCGERPKLPGDVPLLVVCGDLLLDGMGGEGMYDGVLNWLSALGYVMVLVVPGDRDIGLTDEMFEGRARVKFLKDRMWVYNGKYIYGSPWVLKDRHGVARPSEWTWEDDELAERYKAIPSGMDMLVTHGPPSFVLDEYTTKKRCGSVSLAEQVYKKKPRNHVFGHVKRSAGEVHEMALETGRTKFYNVSYGGEKSRSAYVRVKI